MVQNLNVLKYNLDSFVYIYIYKRYNDVELTTIMYG